jgi:1-acyl-sn-glycerol-3-phosphate acyltransferase
VHRSNVDTFVIARITRRRLRYMGKDSLWKYRLPSIFFNAMGGFPVHRGTADREALRKCVEAIRGGEPLVIFPEGTRQSGPIVQPLFEGAAYVSTRTGAPILPVGIGGSEGAMPKGSKFVKPVKIHLVVGPPLRPPVPEEGSRVPRRATKELTDTLHVELQRLFDVAEKRAGAG